MLDPKRDLRGATPETLTRALFRRVVTLLGQPYPAVLENPLSAIKSL